MDQYYSLNFGFLYSCFLFLISQARSPLPNIILRGSTLLLLLNCLFIHASIVNVFFFSDRGYATTVVVMEGQRLATLPRSLLLEAVSVMTSTLYVFGLDHHQKINDTKFPSGVKNFFDFLLMLVNCQPIPKWAF